MKPISELFFRYLCLATAAANCIGNTVIVFFYRPLFALFPGLALPYDRHTFVFESVLSFTMGVAAYFVYRSPQRNIDLLKVGICGKGLFFLATYYFFAFNHIHWFFLFFGLWDLLFVIIFFLFLIQLQSPDLEGFNRGDIVAGLARPATRRALILSFSLTGNGRKGVERVSAGLGSRGYHVDIKFVEPTEPIFRYPLSFYAFWAIVVRALFRRPARIAPLEIPADHDYDLIVVEAQTWLLGTSAVIESIFDSEENRAIFRRRDVAALTICRGAFRRNQAMLVRALERADGNVVGARAYVHEGWEPSRLLSLWLYLIYHRAGEPRWLGPLVQKHYGPSEESFRRMQQYGVALAERRRQATLAEAVRV